MKKRDMTGINICTIRDKASELCSHGTRYGLTSEESKDLALLMVIINKYEEDERKGRAI